MKNEPKMIIVHHTAVAIQRAQLWGVNTYHKEREFPKSSLGYYIGYHYLIERDGTLIKCREEWEEGAHAKGYNFSSVGVCMSGNFNVERPTAAQEETLGKLLGEIVRRYNIPANLILPHRRFAEKGCYGTLLDDKWAALVYIKYELSVITRILARLRMTFNYGRTK